MIATTRFCAEFNVVGSEEHQVDNTGTLYKEYTPTFNCGTGMKYDLNVGLLTYDEAVYAGLTYGHSNDENYLVNNQQYYTMSPAGYSDANRVFIISEYGLIFSDVVGNKYTLRPVISISPDVITTGTGTSDDHYIVK